MNKHLLFVSTTILILIGFGVVTQAFAATTMTIETDSNIYDHASTIILTGNVFPVDLRGSEVTIVCKSPVPGVCGVFQIKPNSDGDFSVSINTATSLMKYDGIYQFEAKYSSLAEATVSVELVNAIKRSSEFSRSKIPSTNAIFTQLISSKIGFLYEGSISFLTGGLEELKLRGLVYFQYSSLPLGKPFWFNQDNASARALLAQLLSVGGV